MNYILSVFTRSLGAALCVALLTVGAIAQNAPAPKEDTFILDPFTVTTQNTESYQASGASSASKFNRPIKDIPHTISIMNEALLRDLAATSLAEALPFIGVSLDNNQRANDSFIVRGYSVNINFTDGVRDGQAFSSGEMAHVQQIEVIKGPASNLYGANKGLGGVINRVTKKPLAKTQQSLNVTVGSESFYRTTLDLTGPVTTDKSLLYRVNVAYQDSGSFRDGINLDRWFIAPVLTKQFGEKTAATLQFEFLEEHNVEDLGYVMVRLSPTGPLVRPTGVPLSRNFGEPWENTTVSKQSARLTLTHAFNDSWHGRLVASQAYIDNPLEHVEFTGVAANQQTLNRRAFWLNRWEDYTYGSADLVGRFTTGPAKHQMIIGVDDFYTKGRSNVRRTSLAAINIYNPVYAVTKPSFNVSAATNSLYTSDNLGAYISDQVSFLDDRLQILGALRRDKATGTTRVELATTTESEEPTNYYTAPQYGFVFRPVRNFTIYGQYSESFRPIPGSSRQLDGSSLRPEIGDITELGIKTTWFNSKLEFDVAAFEINLLDAAVRLDPPNNSFFTNAGSNRGKGVEFSIAYNTQHLNLLAGWLNIDRFNTTPGEPADGESGIAKNQAQFFGKYRFTTGALSGLAIGGGLIWVDDTRTLSNLTDTLPGYTRVDLFASYALRKNMALALNIYNVFDEEYFSGGGSFNLRVGNPMSARFSLRYDF